jgi:hypothetical protein
VLLRLAYLGVTNAFTLLRLLPISDRNKDVEIVALRHQLMVLQRQLDNEKVRFDASDRAFLAAVLHRLPRAVLRQVRLLVRPDTVLRWHGDLLARRHAYVSRPKTPGPAPDGCGPSASWCCAWRGRTPAGVPTPAWRTAGPGAEGGCIHGVGDIEGGRDRPAPELAASTWADFLRSPPIFIPPRAAGHRP